MGPIIFAAGKKMMWGGYKKVLLIELLFFCAPVSLFFWMKEREGGSEKAIFFFLPFPIYRYTPQGGGRKKIINQIRLSAYEEGGKGRWVWGRRERLIYAVFPFSFLFTCQKRCWACRMEYWSFSPDRPRFHTCSPPPPPPYYSTNGSTDIQISKNLKFCMFSEGKTLLCYRVLTFRRRERR